MRPETEQTIRQAWADLLDVERLDGGDRVLHHNPAAETVSFVRILGQGVLSGPSWALERASHLRDDELALLPVLMRLASDHGARPLGAAELSYTDLRVEHADLPTTQDEDAVATLEEACSPADVDEVGLGGMPHRWVILDRSRSAGTGSGAGSEPEVSANEDGDTAEAPPVPLAGSGYVVWADKLAHMGVLTSPQARGRGYGVLAAAVGTNAALDAGLIPQWRARWGNEASTRLAQVLGYEPVGSQTTVYIEG
ncbi:GNAT family N-acetyltransferase [Ornithinimicrobium murale]|uniref:GNAT family N-acetyltransferase n=1 Tax=Ornithinimicrobium murale TaxID=1050153 RepID=UPI000E0D8E4C|nr:GNAT family N-acetyltransferase [Ornithinimicrobium murale]